MKEDCQHKESTKERLCSSSVHSSIDINKPIPQEQEVHQQDQRISEQDNNNEFDDILPTAEGLLRFRDDSQLHKEILTFPQESLHSFRFSQNTTKIHRKGWLSSSSTAIATATGTTTTMPGHHFYTQPVKSRKPNTIGYPVLSTDHQPKNKHTYTIISTSNDNNNNNNNNSHLNEGEDDTSNNHNTLHHASRFIQQNQSILTTYEDWRIILTNTIAQQILGGEDENNTLIGKSILELINPTYRARLKSIIAKRREELNHDPDNVQEGMVLVCGNVLPIIKLDGTKSTASLWLKEKRNESGSSVFIWIFEQVHENLTYISIDKEGIICYVDKTATTLFDYPIHELIGKPMSTIIPSIQPNTIQTVNQLRFFGCQTKKGARFPVIAKLLDTEPSTHHTIQAISMPVLEGLVTVRADNGIIEGCNDAFVNYLFGYLQSDLVGKVTIDKLLPQFPSLLRNLQRDDLLQEGLIINNVICRKLVMADKDQSHRFFRKLTCSPQNQPLPVMYAIHRDGSAFEIQIQLKWVEAENECALWISFDRDTAFKRYGHVSLISPNKTMHIKEEDEELEEEEDEGEEGEAHISHSHLPYTSNNKTASHTTTTTTNNNNNNNGNNSNSNTTITSPSKQLGDIQYSAQTDATSIDDYVILDSLGQGAYGLVKMAVKRDDPTQQRVVIKFVIKSRILVDCWTRDRKLGTIPVEIHILHALKKNPHTNLVEMLDYFEDHDYYYIVMPMYGSGLDLFDYIELKDSMEETEIRSMFRQVALAVKHLHDNRIIHRDIKDENVVLDNERGLRLIDFGSAAYLKPGRKYETFVGTLDYAAPEILRGHTYSGKPQDVWALGILLFTLIYRENPFYDIEEIMSRELRLPFILSPGSVDLIHLMLERDVDKRIDIDQVLAHPWLN